MYQYILIGAFVIITPLTFIIVKSCSKTEKKFTSSPSPKRRREAIHPTLILLTLIYTHLMKNHNYFLFCLPSSYIASQFASLYRL